MNVIWFLKKVIKYCNNIFVRVTKCSFLSFKLVVSLLFLSLLLLSDQTVLYNSQKKPNGCAIETTLYVCILNFASFCYVRLPLSDSPPQKTIELPYKSGPHTHKMGCFCSKKSQDSEPTEAPVRQRRLHNVLWIILFAVACFASATFTLRAKNDTHYAPIYKNGVDSWGNICGQKEQNHVYGHIEEWTGGLLGDQPLGYTLVET